MIAAMPPQKGSNIAQQWAYLFLLKLMCVLGDSRANVVGDRYIDQVHQVQLEEPVIGKG
jgi:hypothetical protein